MYNCPTFCEKQISHFKFHFKEQIQKNVYLNFFIFILFYFSLRPRNMQYSKIFMFWIYTLGTFTNIFILNILFYK